VAKLKGAKKKLIYTRVELTTLWLNWRHRRTYDRLVFESDEKQVTNSEFNMWMPYAIDEAAARKFVDDRGYDRARVQEEVQPWVDHMFEIMANEDDRNYAYIMNWFTWILRKKTKTGTALLLMADHGAGKSVVAERYSQILGAIPNINTTHKPVERFCRLCRLCRFRFRFRFRFTRLTFHVSRVTSFYSVLCICQAVYYTCQMIRAVLIVILHLFKNLFSFAWWHRVGILG